MRRVFLSWLVPLLACTRGGAQAPGPERALDAGVTALVIPAVVAGDATPAAAPRCRLIGAVETIDDGEGKSSADGMLALENVRVLANDATAFVTWERQAQFKMGDSWRTPHATVVGDKRMTALPVDAYACATYGYIAPNTLAEPFVAWGEANTQAFEKWPTLPETTPDAMRPVVKTKPSQVVPTTRQDVHGFVVSRDVALATMAEGTCERMCDCGPYTYGISLVGLERKHPFTVKLASSKDYTKAPEVPAIALGAAGGLAAYRMAGALYIVWLDAVGKPSGAPTKFDEGDVGAPAVAVTDGEAVLSWVRREGKTEPYRLRWSRMPIGSALPAPEVVPTNGAAYAPAALLDATSTTLAWMEGDGGKTGEIHVARIFGKSVPESLVVSTGETNARDPELSGTAAAPALVYSTFSKDRLAGLIRFARLFCD